MTKVEETRSQHNRLCWLIFRRGAGDLPREARYARCPPVKCRPVKGFFWPVTYCAFDPCLCDCGGARVFRLSLFGSAGPLPLSRAPPPCAEKRLSRNQPWLFMMWDVAEWKQEGSRQLPASSCFSQQRCGFFPLLLKRMLPFKGFLICKLFPQFFPLL